MEFCEACDHFKVTALGEPFCCEKGKVLDRLDGALCDTSGRREFNTMIDCLHDNGITIARLREERDTAHANISRLQQAVAGRLSTIPDGAPMSARDIAWLQSLLGPELRGVTSDEPPADDESAR